MALNLAAPQCSAHSKRSGARCRNPCVSGFNVCWMHGAGRRSRPGGRPVVHGRYSRQLPAALASRYVAALEDPKLLGLRYETALIVARMGELVSRLDGAEDSNIWSEIGTTIDLLRRVVESERRYMIESQQMISVDQLLILFSVISDILKRHVSNPVELAAISAELRRLTIIDARPQSNGV